MADKNVRIRIQMLAQNVLDTFGKVDSVIKGVTKSIGGVATASQGTTQSVDSLGKQLQNIMRQNISAVDDLGNAYKINLVHNIRTGVLTATATLDQLAMKSKAVRDELEQSRTFAKQSGPVRSPLATGFTDTATIREQNALVMASAALEKLRVQHGLTKKQIIQMYQDIKENGLMYYKDGLEKVQAAIIKLQEAQINAGKTVFDLEQKLRKQDAAAEQQHLKQKAAWRDQFYKEEAARQQQLAAQQEALRQKELSALRADIEQRNAMQERALMASTLLGPDLRKGTPQQQSAYIGQANAVMTWAQQNGIAAAQVNAMWNSLANGPVKIYDAKMAELQNKLMALRAAHEQLGKTGKNAVNSLTLSWQTMERMITAGLLYRAIYSVITAMKEGLKSSIELQKRVAEIQTISQDKQLPFNQWQQGIRGLSDTWGLDILQQAEAAYQTISNQIAFGTEAIQFMSEANQFAITTVSSVADSVNLLTAAINSYGLSAGDAHMVAAKMFKTIELGRVRTNEMAETFGRTSVMAQQLGVSLDELLSMYQVLTIQGMRYNEAATQLRGLMMKMLKPTEETKKMFREMGIVSAESASYVWGFSNLLERLKNRTKGVSTEIAKHVDLVRGLNANLVLVGPMYERYRQNVEKTKQAEESYNAAVELVMKTSAKQLEIQGQRLKNFFRVDVASRTISMLSKLTNGFENLAERAEFAATAISMLLIPALTSLGHKMLVFTVTHPHVVALTTALLAFKYVIDSTNKSFEKMVQNTKKFYDDQAKAFDFSQQKAEAYFNDLLTMATNTQNKILANWIAEQLKELTATEKHYNKLKDMIKGHQDEALASMRKIVNDTDKFYQKLISNIEDYWENLDKSFAERDRNLFELWLKPPDEDTLKGKLRKLRQDMDHAIDQFYGVEVFDDLEESITGSEKAMRRLNSQFSSTSVNRFGQRLPNFGNRHGQRLPNFVHPSVYGGRTQSVETFEPSTDRMFELADKTREYEEQIAAVNREYENTYYQIGMIEDRLDQLRMRRDEQASVLDTEGFNRTSDEIMDWLGRRQELIRSTGDMSNDYFGMQMMFQDEIVRLTEEEDQLRWDMVSASKALLVLEKDRVRAQGKELVDYEDNLRKFNDFKIKDLYDITDPDEIRKVFDDQMKTIEKLREFEESFTGDARDEGRIQEYHDAEAALRKFGQTQLEQILNAANIEEQRIRQEALQEQYKNMRDLQKKAFSELQTVEQSVDVLRQQGETAALIGEDEWQWRKEFMTGGKYAVAPNPVRVAAKMAAGLDMGGYTQALSYGGMWDDPYGIKLMDLGKDIAQFYDLVGKYQTHQLDEAGMQDLVTLLDKFSENFTETTDETGLAIQDAITQLRLRIQPDPDGPLIPYATYQNNYESVTQSIKDAAEQLSTKFNVSLNEIVHYDYDTMSVSVREATEQMKAFTKSMIDWADTAQKIRDRNLNANLNFSSPVPVIPQFQDPYSGQAFPMFPFAPTSPEAPAPYTPPVPQIQFEDFERSPQTFNNTFNLNTTGNESIDARRLMNRINSEQRRRASTLGARRPY